jgi:DNA-binding transcriptional regulator YiaG
MNNICPVCGSDKIERITKEHTISEPFGGTKNISISEVECKACGSTGDFFNENDSIIDSSIKELKQKSINNILNDFSENKISMSAIERALDIPQRTLAKWRSGSSSPTATGVALMRFIRLFPWLLDVAENKYDYDYAQKICINSGIQKLLSCISFKTEDFSEAGIIATSRSAFMYMYFEKEEFNNVNEQFEYKTITTKPVLIPVIAEA